VNKSIEHKDNVVVVVVLGGLSFFASISAKERRTSTLTV
jgi:hypothetical protein